MGSIREPSTAKGGPVSPIAVKALVLAVVYAGLSRAVTVVTAFGGSEGTTFWPAAGVTVAFLLWRPRREWPALLAGVWLAEFLLNFQVTHLAADVSAGWATANIVEPLLAAWLLTRNRRPAPSLDEPADLLRFVVFAVIVGPGVGALVGVGSGRLAGFYAMFPALPRWFAGDAIGALVLGPATLALLQGRLRRRDLTRQAMLWLALAVGGAMVIMVPEVEWGGVLPYLIVPVLVVLGLKAGPAGGALGIAGVGLAVNAMTAAGRGPFALDNEIIGLIEAQAFLGLAAFTTLIVAALTADLVRREAAERIKNTFIETCAHDLRGPIGIIQGFVELLEADGGIDQSHRYALGRIRATSDRMLSLIRDILDLQRLSSAPQGRMERIDVASVARALVAELPAGGRTLRLNAAPVIAVVDRLGFERIVENLVSNAVKFSPEGSSIEVTVAAGEGGLVISVDDEGPGVPPHQKVQIFRPFEQGSARGGGMGVGLAIVNEFAALHGGRAWVEDRPEGGSSFRVVLNVECDAVPPVTNEVGTGDETSLANA